MKVNHIAVVGLGSIGCRHLRILRELRPSINITVVRSGKGVKRDEEQLADKIVFSLDEAVKTDIQAAIISTPASFHTNQALVLAKAGVHLFVEKPLSHKLDNLDKLRCLIQKKEMIKIISAAKRKSAIYTQPLLTLG